MTPSTPNKEDFAHWSRVWHDTCETIVTMLGLPGCGSPQELLAQVQAHVAPSTPAPADAGTLADELRAFCAAAPHDYPGHNIELFQRCEAALRNSAPQETREPMDYGQELLRWSNIEIALRKKFPTLAATGTEIDGWPDLITALQETRGDEPTDEWCNAFLKSMGQWVEPHEPETECGIAIECGITQEDADGINAEFRASIREALADASPLATPQQSPRLEREGALKMVAALFAESVHETYTREEVVSVVEDMIRLGQSPVSSTERCECIGGSTYNDGTQRRCDLCGKPVPPVSSKDRGSE